MSLFSKLKDLKSTGNALTQVDSFPARVVNNADPLKLQRVQFRLKGLHRNVQDADLPWAIPDKASKQGNNAVGSIEIPVLGSTVWIRFLDENTPVYSGVFMFDSAALAELTGTHYPKVYGFIDASGNKFIVDTEVDTVTFTHLSGAKINITANGECSFDTENLTLNVNGNLNVKSSGGIEFDCQSFKVNSQSVALKTLTLDVDAATINSKSATRNESSASYNLDAATVTIKGGITSISSAAVLTLSAASTILSTVTSVTLKAAAFAVQAAFNLVPLMGWATPPIPSPGATVPPTVSPPTPPVVIPPLPLVARTKPVIVPFSNQVNY